MIDDTQPTPLIKRLRIIDGLRDLAAFLEANPDLPMPTVPEINLSVVGDSDETEREEIDRIAGILGTEPRTMYGPHYYTASRTFGALVYRATCISAECMRRYNEKMALIDVIDQRGDVSTEEWPV